ncbi:hypothetical protein [Streptomyces klenkii]|uniref:hypothetical protein n=1 Tax=Streptomyces klenkii TaxID=1420899 RepID=UPI001319CA48|nr:hypothetical protein [Streptomyces klenkii]
MRFLLIRIVQLRTISPYLVEVSEGYRAQSGWIQPTTLKSVEAIAKDPWEP